MTAFARLATPIFPVMDNMYLDSFFFFVPNRLLWENWQRFMGEQTDPGDSTAYLVPQIECPEGGYEIGTVYDYMGLPTVGQVATVGGVVSHSALHLRAYNLIWNEWFRDQNLQDSLPVNIGDGPDNPADYVLQRRGKRHDYFTSALPWPQKGDAVSLPLGTSAPIKWDQIGGSGAAPDDKFSIFYTNNTSPGLAVPRYSSTYASSGTDFGTGSSNYNMYADLSLATSATINQLRESFQIQRLLERDARGGTRYTEIIRSHFGVISPDARLQRPEYLGGGSAPVIVNPIAQTSATSIDGSDSPLGNLGAMATALAKGHGFTQSFTEHGVVIGLVAIRADLTYQQGMKRMWSRRTRYDYYFPVFAHLGEQAVLNKEIYVQGTSADDDVFGYQERWAEYRYHPAMITSLFRSTAAGTLDAWHLAQKFNTLPTLNDTFIQDNPPVDRVVAIGEAANGQQFIFDSFFDIRAARPMPLYSVPGLIDHF